MSKIPNIFVPIVVALSFFTFSGQSRAQMAQANELRVTVVRAYNTGDIHIFLSPDVSEACGDRLRVIVKPGQDSVRTVALAAMISEGLVDVAFEAQRTGNFCNLISIQLRKP